MKFVTQTLIRVREWHKGLSKGQTMTEYALIMAAVFLTHAVVLTRAGQKLTSEARRYQVALDDLPAAVN